MATASHSIIGTIGAGSLPTATALSQDGSTIYVASYFATAVYQISVQTGALTGLEVGLGFNPISVSRDPQNANVVYVGSATEVAIVDMNSGAFLQTFPFGAGSLAALSVGPNQSYVYATYQGSVYWMDAVQRTLKGIIPLQQSAGITLGRVITSSANQVYVQTDNITSQPSPIITFAYDGSAMQDIPVTASVRDIALSFDGKTLYATGGKDVFEWNTTTAVVTPIGSFAAGKAPGQIVVANSGLNAYVADRENNIETIDLPSGQITSTTGVLGAVRAMTLSPDGANLFIANDSSGTDLVPITSGPSEPSSFLYARFSGYYPFTSAVSPNTQFLWTSCRSGNGVMVNTSVFPPYSYFYAFAPSYAVFSPDSSTLYATHSVGTTAKPQWAVTSINSTTLVQGNTLTLPAGLVVVSKPVVTPSNTALFIPVAGSKSSGIVSTSIVSNSIIRFIPLAGVSAVALSPNGQTLYAAYNTPSPSIAVINVPTKTITSSFSPAVTTNLKYLVVSPDGTRLYGASTSEIFGITIGNLSNPIHTTVPDNGLTGIAITTDGLQLFLSDLRSQNSISLDTTTLAQVSSTFLFAYGSDVVIAH